MTDILYFFTARFAQDAEFAVVLFYLLLSGSLLPVSQWQK